MEKNYLKNFLKNEYYKFYIPFLKRKFPKLQRKKVIVLGSGPNAILDKENLNNYEVVCCNGSASYLKRNKLNKIPYLTIIDNELIDKKIVYEKNIRKNIIQNKLLKGINLGNLISVQSNHSNNSDPSILEADYNSYTHINKNFRRSIVNELVKINFIENDNQSLLSTGLFAISLCLLLGAERVEFTGFSLWKEEEKDYFYSQLNDSLIEKKLIRNHSLADIFYISLLKIKKFNIHTKDIDFLPLMSNWGDSHRNKFNK
jgi:hypothetical protein